MHRRSGITAIIPTYNRATLLPTAIDSILAQTMEVAEVIVVDDGSTDGTPELVRDMAARDPRIRLLVQSRGGANRARNAGAAAATGAWLAFLDSDDMWEPEKLQRQFEALAQKPGAVAAFCGFRMIGGDASEKTFLPPLDPSLWSLRCANVLSSTSAALVRASVLRDVGGFDPDLPSCQDWDLWFRLRRAGPFAVVREPLVRLNDGDHERITNNLDKVLRGHSEIFARLTQDLGEGARRQVAASHKLVLANLYRFHRQPGRAFRLACASLAARPSRWGVRLAIESGQALLRARRSAQAA